MSKNRLLTDLLDEIGRIVFRDEWIGWAAHCDAAHDYWAAALTWKHEGDPMDLPIPPPRARLALEARDLCDAIVTELGIPILRFNFDGQLVDERSDPDGMFPSVVAVDGAQRSNKEQILEPDALRLLELVRSRASGSEQSSASPHEFLCAWLQDRLDSGPAKPTKAEAHATLQNEFPNLTRRQRDKFWRLAVKAIAPWLSRGGSPRGQKRRSPAQFVRPDKRASH